MVENYNFTKLKSLAIAHVKKCNCLINCIQLIWATIDLTVHYSSLYDCWKVPRVKEEEALIAFKKALYLRPMDVDILT